MENILQIVRTYLSHHDIFPPMVIGFDSKSNPFALVGSFRDFQEQVTFCAVAKMAFSLYDIENYHIITHGYMRNDLTETSDKQKVTNQLIRFLGNKKTEQLEGYGEVLIDAFISPKQNECSVYKFIRDDNKKLKRFQKIITFDSSDLIKGMFTQLLDDEQFVSNNLTSEVESIIERIRYNIPKAVEKKVTSGLDKLWGKK